APVFPGDTVYARSKVLDVRESKSRPTQGIVTTSTEGYKADGTVFMYFERSALIPKRGHGVGDYFSQEQFMSTTQPNIAAQLGAFTTSLNASDVPADVRLRGQHHILDAIGIALASGRFDFAKKTLAGIKALGGTGEVPVIGMAAKLSPRDAAMMNG